jgi:O-methyltransferase involved in polyketide biosynthesis
VVALGEGLETQFWRVDDGRLRWMGVDLPVVSALRRQVLPAHHRYRQVAGSVLDDGWMNSVDASRGLLITAQGLLMYLQRDQVLDLVARCAARFPGSSMVFDGVPRWTTWVTSKMARSSNSVTGAAGGMQAPPMPWPMDSFEAKVLRSIPGVQELKRLHPPRGRNLLHGTVLPVFDRLPLAQDLLLSVWNARF